MRIRAAKSRCARSRLARFCREIQVSADVSCGVRASARTHDAKPDKCARNRNLIVGSSTQKHRKIVAACDVSGLKPGPTCLLSRHMSSATETSPGFSQSLVMLFRGRNAASLMRLTMRLTAA